VQAAARRAGAHLILEAKRPAEKIKRRANVAVEEIEMISGGFGVIDVQSPLSLLPQGEGMRSLSPKGRRAPHFPFIVQFTS
jgi:hypothetical protein